MSLNYCTMPGEIIKLYIDERGLTQKQLAELTTSSEKHISEVINGNATVTTEFALKLEKAFPDTPAEFWLDLENAYRLFLLRNNKNEIKDAKKIVKDFKLNHVFKGLDYNDEQKVNEMFNILGVKKIEEVKENIKNLQSIAFMHDKGNENTLYLWLKLCEEEIEVQNDIEKFPAFNHEKFVESLSTIKKILNTTDYVMALTNIKSYFKNLGVGIVFEEAIPTSKVRGATMLYKNHPMIFLSNRYKRIDAIYFALIHEVFHIVNNDYEKESYAISYEDDESEINSNYGAQTFFINEYSFNKFVEKGNFSKEAIILFARENDVIVDIALGQLSHRKIIGYDQYRGLKTFINEEEMKNVYLDVKK